MTDFFGDLERELRAAHARDERGWRPALRALLPRRSTVMRFAMASAASVAVIALVTLVLANSGGERESEVAAPGLSPAACDSETQPVEIERLLGVLARPATDQDRLPDRLSAGLDENLAGSPIARPFLDGARMARPGVWVVPALVGDPCEGPGACLVLDREDTAVGACGTLVHIRGGLSSVDVPVDGPRRLSHVALVPDDARPQLEVNGRPVPGGDVVGNVFMADYEGSVSDHASVRLEDVQNLHSPDSGWTAYGPCPGAGPDALVERFAVLRQRPDPPTDFVLDEPDVVPYGEAGRFVRFGNGLEVLVVPAELGECRSGQPGICLIPSDRDWATDCFAVPEDEPFVGVLMHDDGAEVEVAGVVDDDVRAVDVNGLEVESQAGTVLAVVHADDPSQVSVRPVE